MRPDENRVIGPIAKGAEQRHVKLEKTVGQTVPFLRLGCFRETHLKTRRCLGSDFDQQKQHGNFPWLRPTNEPDHRQLQGKTELVGHRWGRVQVSRNGHCVTCWWSPGIPLCL